MLRPTSNCEVSTISGTRGGVARSRSKLIPPRARLRPPLSMAAFADAGFTSGTLLGESASARLSARKRILLSSRQSSAASSTSSSAVRSAARYACTMRRSSGFSVQAGSANRRSRLGGATTEVPTAIRVNSAARPPARLLTVSGRRASPAANLTVDAFGANLRSGPNAASTSSASSGAASSASWVSSIGVSEVVVICCPLWWQGRTLVTAPASRLTSGPGLSEDRFLWVRTLDGHLRFLPFGTGRHAPRSARSA